MRTKKIVLELTEEQEEALRIALDERRFHFGQGLSRNVVQPRHSADDIARIRQRREHYSHRLEILNSIILQLGEEGI